MSALDPQATHAPACCERCGSILVVFEPHPDGDHIYCACRCVVDAGRAHESRSSSSPAGAASKKGARRCQRCGGVRIVVGTRPDGSPIEAECSCQRTTRSDADAGHQPAQIAEPVVAFAPAELKSGHGTLVTLGVGVALVALALFGILRQRQPSVSLPALPAKAVAPSKMARAPVGTPTTSMLPGGVEVRNDASGAATLVSGVDPGAVLRAFCRHPQFNAAMVPGTLQSTTPPDPDLLLGSAILMDGKGSLRQLMLKRDAQTGRWSIGDGKSAIVPVTSITTP